MKHSPDGGFRTSISSRLIRTKLKPRSSIAMRRLRAVSCYGRSCSAISIDDRFRNHPAQTGIQPRSAAEPFELRTKSIFGCARRISRLWPSASFPCRYRNSIYAVPGIGIRLCYSDRFSSNERRCYVLKLFHKQRLLRAPCRQLHRLSVWRPGQ